MQDRVANRYANAFFGWLGGDAKVRKSIDELQAFAELLKTNKELHLVLVSDVFPNEERAGVLKDLGAKLDVSKETLRLLTVLNEAPAKRLDRTGLIAEGLKAQLLAAAEVIPLQISSATLLAADEKKTVEKKFSALLGKKVEASYDVDASLIGGVRVTAGSRTFDGTVSGGLAQIGEKLIGGSI